MNTRKLQHNMLCEMLNASNTLSDTFIDIIESELCNEDKYNQLEEGRILFANLINSFNVQFPNGIVWGNKYLYNHLACERKRFLKCNRLFEKTFLMNNI